MARTPREPILDLQDPDLSGKRFERFCLDLVRALPDVADAHLYARHGERQRGIDIHADLCDGRVRTIQCRRVKRFTKASAEKLIADTTYQADEHWVWCTCPMSAGARDVLRGVAQWDGWDIEQLSSAVRGLPREVGRWMIEDHLGSGARKRLLGPEADLCIAPANQWFARSDERAAALRTNQSLRGRGELLDRMVEAVHGLDYSVVLLVGWGGIGKTRMLRALADTLDDDRVLLLRDGVEVTAALAEELPTCRFTLLIDDAHRRSGLPAILATVFTSDEPRTVVLATRPQRLAALRADLLNTGISPASVVELNHLAPLTHDQAQALALDELDEAHQGAADSLAVLTRDVPALCVLGARLINDGDLAPGELVNHEAARADILARFRDELVGKISEEVDPAVVRGLLVLIAALQPLELTGNEIATWLSEQVGRSPAEVRHAIRGIEQSGLLGGTKRRRIVPDVLADHVLREACVEADGRSSGRADELLALAPPWAMSRVLANLAELDWRLGSPGEHPVLDTLLTGLEREILAARAWDRSQMLERLKESAVFLADWIVTLARHVLDRPAQDSVLFAEHEVTDTDARRALVPLLGSAGLVPVHTATALRLLWEIGRDVEPKGAFSGEEPLDAIRWFGSYELNRHYQETLLEVVEQLVMDEDEAECHRIVPITLLMPLTSREGTTSSSKGYTVSLGAYFVDAIAAKELRDRLRVLLVNRCLHGGPRTRFAAGGLLGEMLRQPHGYFGASAPPAAIAQWRTEQLALLEDISDLLHRSDDVVVIARLRDSLDWPGRHSTIRGTKTAVRRIQRANGMSTDELLLRVLTGGFDHFESHEAAQRRIRGIAQMLMTENPRVDGLLMRIDDMLTKIAASDPQRHTDAGALMGALMEQDADWGLEAVGILAAAPQRPVARALGVLLTVAVTSAPGRAREVLEQLVTAKDVVLRRYAADHISRMAWVSDPEAPERRLAVTLAADSDPVVVRCIALAALRAADEEPEFARAVVLAFPTLGDRILAEDVCMVLTHEIGLTKSDNAELLRRLLQCPEVAYWHDRMLVAMSAREPQQVLEYLLARIDNQDRQGYWAVPFDGLSGDPLARHPHLRASSARQIVESAARSDGMGPYGAASLFWSYADGRQEGLDVLAEAIASTDAELWDAALGILSHGPHGIILANPSWVANLLETVDTAVLDEAQGALSSALTMGSRQGTPGKPFPRDVALRDRSAEYAKSARPGSSAAAFWTLMVRQAERAIRQSLERDRLFDDE
ncbi:MAG TPA: hypothetical protein VE972_01030 [Conexibacter sp.]|nr:hypothetical protein [Conexibacter sp.]